MGAKCPALRTNPLAFALPGEVDPFIFDMGTGATMWGEVLLKAFLDEEFPEEVGVDSDGVPTKRAKDIVHGGVIPFAGHKGYGLSIAIQALGLSPGATTAGSPRLSLKRLVPWLVHRDGRMGVRNR